MSAIVFLSDAVAGPPSRGIALAQLFGLMPSEVRMTDCLLEGLHIKEAAERLHLTENSARFLVKEIFRKQVLPAKAAYASHADDPRPPCGLPAAQQPIPQRMNVHGGAAAGRVTIPPT